MKDDLIRRQDVLALSKDVTLKNGAKHRCVDTTEINILPSVQPEWNEMIVICDCCGHAIQVKRQ